MLATASSTEVRVRAAEPRDGGAIAAIFNQGIEERQATFQTVPHGREDFLERIRDESRPFLVAESGGEVVGWAAVVGYSDRAAYYSGIGEAMLYVERSARRAGIGSRLLEELAAEAVTRGLYKLVGKIFTTNAPSIALVLAGGWREVGTHRRHGRLDGEWRDVLVVERLIGEAADENTKGE
jgi:L-amino acid N-acyltransferase YncA